MSLPYDATLKMLLETSPAAWPELVGIAAESVEVRDADVSTVTAATDKVLLVHTRGGDLIQHYDFQSGPDAGVPRRAHSYNGILEVRHELPVDTVVVLLCRKANLTTIDGLYQKFLPDATEPYLTFRYRVLRVWELDPERLLAGSLGLLPLAPISAVTQTQVPRVIARMRERLDGEPEQLSAELWTATGVLLGLRYQREFVQQVLQGVRNMKESTFYQGILDEGREEGREEGILLGRIQEARGILTRAGQRKFHCAPNKAEVAALAAITDPARLEELLDQVPGAASWAELLGLPAPARKRKKS